MSIESDLKGINTNLARVADALEALVAAQGIVPGDEEFPVPPPPTPVEEAEEKLAAKPSKKKATKKKASKKKGETKVGKDPEPVETELTKADVRAVLMKVKAINPALPKSLLKEFGASSLPQLDESKYEALITRAESELDDD